MSTKIEKMTEIRYLKMVKDVTDQYDEGAITARELSNKIAALTDEVERMWPSDLKEGEHIIIRPVQTGHEMRMSFSFNTMQLEGWIYKFGDEGNGVNIYGDPETLDSIYGHQLLMSAEIIEIKVEEAQ